MPVDVAYYMNADPENFFGYKQAHLVVLVGPVPVSRLYTTDVAVCEEAFGIMNRDDRPYPTEARSMSVGDVVRLSVPMGEDRWYTCARFGWEQIDPPLTVDVHGRNPFEVVCALNDKLR